MGQLMRVEELLCKSRSKQKKALGKVKRYMHSDVMRYAILELRAQRCLSSRQVRLQTLEMCSSQFFEG